MNDLLRAVVLGVIEGLTEFLPVSSTGHLVIAMPALGIDPDRPEWKVFLFVCQIGAILGVVAYFARDLWQRLMPPAPTGWHRSLLTRLAAGVTPALVVGAALDPLLAPLERSPAAVASALIGGALLMELIDRRCRRAVPMTLDDVSLKQALAIGVIQCISIWPGTSRAAATIMGGMLVGLTPAVATQFSFYLAIPTIFAAGGYRLIKYADQLTAAGLGMVLLGTLVSFVVALLVVAGFMRYVQRRRFTPFVVYRILLGVGVLAWYRLAGPS